MTNNLPGRLRTPALVAALASALASPAPARMPAFQIPPACTQAIVATAPDWNTSSGSLQRWERRAGTWVPVGSPLPVRFGKNGLAWGLGLHPTEVDGPQKREGDGRAPAGVFALGGAYGYAPDIPRRPSLPYHQVRVNDLWVEDTASPDYNRHLKLPGGRGPETEWEKQQQMKQDDPAHSLKLFIAHNAAPGAVPGAGSAIFFHIWREAGAKPSTGCTVMAEPALKELIAWVDPAQKPVYILLTQDDYTRLRTPWALP